MAEKEFLTGCSPRCGKTIRLIEKAKELQAQGKKVKVIGKDGDVE